MAIAPHKLTYDDYAALPDDGKRYQLIDGELVLTPSGTPNHQKLVGRLFLEIGLYLRQHAGAGELFVAPLDVVLDRYQVLQPDLLFISGARADLVGPKYITAAPDLVVEVLSPSTARLDLGRKRELYEQFGAREFWAVHQKRVLVEIHRLGADGRYAPPANQVDGAILETPILPGFTLAIDDLFAGLAGR